MRTMWIGLGLVSFCCLVGCSFNASGSVMRQWDRPAEATTTTTTDILRTTTLPQQQPLPQQGNVGVVK